MKYNNHQDLQKEVERLLSIYSSFSTVFRHAMSKTDIGDYLVSKIVLRGFLAHDIPLSRSKITAALRYSEDFKTGRDKTSWINDLVDMISYYKQNNDRI